VGTVITVMRQKQNSWGTWHVTYTLRRLAITGMTFYKDYTAVQTFNFKLLAIAIAPESKRALSTLVGFTTESNSLPRLRIPFHPALHCMIPFSGFRHDHRRLPVVAGTVISFHRFVSNHNVFWT
jgi:hypothetical protein